MDYTIINGTVVDGTGRPGFRADVAVADGTIAAVAPSLPRRGSVIDAEGQVVCPGFIDIHSHSSLIWLSDPRVDPKIHQGITTEVAGLDGYSAAPISPRDQPLWRAQLEGLEGNPGEWDWQSFAQYRDRLVNTSPNWAPMVGHGNLRLAVLGMENRPATPDELRSMAEVLEASFQEGASALSSGLIYVPQAYGNLDELVALGKVVARHGKFFSFHIRSQGDFIVPALEEVLEVGRRSGCSIQITHFQIGSRQMWGRLDRVVEMIESARREGVDVACDQYVYTAGSTFLSAVLPPWATGGGPDGLRRILESREERARLERDTLEGLPGQWDSRFRTTGPENIYVSFVKSSANEGLVGKSLSQIAEVWGVTPYEALIRLLLEEEFAVTMILFSQSEEVVEEIMKLPWHMFCSDAVMIGKPHPRAYGNYPRILGHFVRERRVLTLEDAIKKATSVPAARLGLRDRGVVEEGKAADLVVFDPARVKDTATYDDPMQYPVGINHVLVNGRLVISEGRHTGALPGHAL
ncbi:MAG: N-acyl-D-amino-acid deacylase family protein [Sphingomonadaceae bacterium]